MRMRKKEFLVHLIGNVGEDRQEVCTYWQYDLKVGMPSSSNETVPPFALERGVRSIPTWKERQIPTEHIHLCVVFLNYCYASG